MNIVQALNKVKNDLLVFITTNLNNKSDVGHTHDEYAGLSHDHDLVTTSAPGFMDAADKIALDSLSGLIGDTSVSEQINNAIGAIVYPVSSVNGKTGNVSLVAPDVGAVSMTTFVAELTVDGWIDNVQTVNVSGVTESNDVFVSATPGTHEEYMNCGIFCITQGVGILTFECEEVPTIDVNANVCIFTQ